nr:amino acid permease [Mergibacter septicus]
MLSQLTVILYLVMYLLMFAVAIYLRYSQLNCPRPYRIPGGGDIGMWIVGIAGFIGSLLTFIFRFILPSQINVSNPTFYVSILVELPLFFCVLPLLFITIENLISMIQIVILCHSLGKWKKIDIQVFHHIQIRIQCKLNQNKYRKLQAKAIFALIML